MVKEFLKKLKARTPSWVWAILAVYAGIMSILGLCIAIKLGGIHISAAYSWVANGFVDNHTLAIALLAGVLGAIFTHFGRDSYIFWKKTIHVSIEGG